MDGQVVLIHVELFNDKQLTRSRCLSDESVTRLLLNHPVKRFVNLYLSGMS